MHVHAGNRIAGEPNGSLRWHTIRPTEHQSKHLQHLAYSAVAVRNAEPSKPAKRLECKLLAHQADKGATEKPNDICRNFTPNRLLRGATARQGGANAGWAANWEG
eukprot:CAMPEP_0171096672 /NCGR_PEP_ID=MMETSP0766_2-20121228/45540_1 /TAXON_ID=439317 /ORGANISM="Gambierdiscus australes, Strain CAWD 149" /LENGTH=104 /DNA_ID=CAMNT_0011555699 /DNA_START=77 /DNA_END=392 /DNA_ORIENTATION=-